MSLGSTHRVLGAIRTGWSRFVDLQSNAGLFSGLRSWSKIKVNTDGKNEAFQLLQCPSVACRLVLNEALVRHSVKLYGGLDIERVLPPLSTDVVQKVEFSNTLLELLFKVVYLLQDPRNSRLDEKNDAWVFLEKLGNNIPQKIKDKIYLYCRAPGFRGVEITNRTLVWRLQALSKISLDDVSAIREITGGISPGDILDILSTVDRYVSIKIRDRGEGRKIYQKALMRIISSYILGDREGYLQLTEMIYNIKLPIAQAALVFKIAEVYKEMGRNGDAIKILASYLGRCQNPLILIGPDMGGSFRNFILEAADKFVPEILGEEGCFLILDRCRELDFPPSLDGAIVNAGFAYPISPKIEGQLTEPLIQKLYQLGRVLFDYYQDEKPNQLGIRSFIQGLEGLSPYVSERVVAQLRTRVPGDLLARIFMPAYR